MRLYCKFAQFFYSQLNNFPRIQIYIYYKINISTSYYTNLSNYERWISTHLQNLHEKKKKLKNNQIYIYLCISVGVCACVPVICIQPKCPFKTMTYLFYIFWLLHRIWINKSIDSNFCLFESIFVYTNDNVCFPLKITQNLTKMAWVQIFFSFLLIIFWKTKSWFIFWLVVVVVVVMAFLCLFLKFFRRWLKDTGQSFR